MNKPFFITGLPRSRTAWLANYLTTDKTHCYHELIGECDSWQEYQDKLNKNDKVYGDSSSGLIFNIEHFIERYPNSKWICIRRPFADVIFSLEKKGFSLNSTEMRELENTFKNAYKILYDKANISFFAYDELNETKTIEMIWSFCCPSLPVPIGRAENLQKFNIQIDLSRIPMGKLLWTPQIK
jgi:hypothetical protein